MGYSWESEADGKLTEEKRNEVLAEIVKKYNITETTSRGNCDRTYILTTNDHSIWIGSCPPKCYSNGEMFSPGLLCVSIGFGEVRHIGENHTPLAERGMVSASFSFKERIAENGPGHAIYNFDILGTRWRIGGVYPKGRTSALINDKRDQYVKTEDIVAFLLSLKVQVTKGTTAKGDMTYGMWDEAKIGW